MSYITMKRKAQGAIAHYTSLMTLLMGLPAQAASQNQLWYFDTTSGGIAIRSYLSGLCLSSPIFAKNGEIPFMQSCNGSYKWKFQPTGDGLTYYVISEQEAGSKYLSRMALT